MIRTKDIWKRSITPEIESIWTREKINDVISNIKDKKHRAFLSLLYLTAGRISEVLEVKKLNITNFVSKGVVYLKTKMINEKNRNIKTKDVPFVEEDVLVKNILDYKKDLKYHQKLFDFSRVTGWRLLVKYTGLWPHSFRHFRLTELAVVYDFNEIDLMKLAGWSTPTMARIYVRKKVADIADKMGKLHKSG